MPQIVLLEVNKANSQSCETFNTKGIVVVKILLGAGLNKIEHTFLKSFKELEFRDETSSLCNSIECYDLCWGVVSNTSLKYSFFFY